MEAANGEYALFLKKRKASDKRVVEENGGEDDGEKVVGHVRFAVVGYCPIL